MLVMDCVFYLLLLVSSAYSQGQQALPPLARPPPVNMANQRNENAGNDGIIHQAAVNFTDLSPDEQIVVLGTRISDGITHSVQQPSSQQTSNLRPARFVPHAPDMLKRYKLVEGLGYYRIVKGLHLDWDDARIACMAEGAHLAVVNSAREADALKHLYYEEGIKTDLVIHTIWVGAMRPQGQQDYVTVHGTQLKDAGFDVWTNGKRNKNTEEQCVVLDVKQAALTSIPCRAPQHHVCEREL